MDDVRHHGPLLLEIRFSEIGRLFQDSGHALQTYIKNPGVFLHFGGRPRESS